MTVSAPLSGLSAGTTYHYRLVANNADGGATGSDQTFTTSATIASPSRPTASTGNARAVHEVSAKLAGRINANGLATTYHFEYGKTTAYGSSTATATLPASGTTAGVSARLTGLKTGTTYHYRLVASNADGTTAGADATFKTASRLRANLLGIKRSYSGATVAGKGLRVTYSCNQACSFAVSLTISAKTAKALGIGKHQIVIAKHSGRSHGTRTGHFQLHVSGKDKHAAVALTECVADAAEHSDRRRADGQDLRSR